MVNQLNEFKIPSFNDFRKFTSVNLFSWHGEVNHRQSLSSSWVEKIEQFFLSLKENDNNILGFIMSVEEKYTTITQNVEGF